jgi:alkane 1-monooxygenase
VLTGLIAFFLPLWHMVMSRKLIEWDNTFSSDEERKITAPRNLDSGQEELIREGRKYLD